ncbi:hypothetical protein VB773_14360 [Haloarculaceae archaeon H-GB2-1]|nr:hypothetical protein [Haloarculaceae archaeon H-GB2-1]
MQSQLTVARLRDRLPEILTALLAGSAGVAGSYAAAGFTPGFVVAPIEGFLARTMPGVVVTFAIQTLGSLGQQLSLLTAIALAVVAFSSLVGIGIVVGARLDSPWVAALLAGALPWGVTTLLTGDPVVALGAGLPPTLVVAVEESSGAFAERTTPTSRRVDVASSRAPSHCSASAGSRPRSGPASNHRPASPSTTPRRRPRLTRLGRRRQTSSPPKRRASANASSPKPTRSPSICRGWTRSSARSSTTWTSTRSTPR